MIGTPISVRSTAELYYVPVFYEDNCVHIVTVLQDGSTYSMSSGRMFADIINQLTPGYYYIEDDAESDVVYLKGDSLKIAIDGDFCPDYDNIGNSERTIISEKDEITVDMFGNGLYRVEDVAVRGQNSYSLSINTRFPNGGAYGYCWLCAACEISVYFGGSNVGLEAAHIEVHGPIYPPSGHTLYNCPGAMLPTDINTVVNHYAGKTASLSYSLTAYQTMQSIYSSQNPIYSSWKYYDGENWHGHAMVIVGYVYITEPGSFTYVLHDSNDISGNRYAYSTYSVTSVTYPVGSNNYTWMYSLYNWN